MIISLVRMPPDGIRFNYEYQTGELDVTGREFEFRALPRVVGRVDRVGMEMRLRGEIATTIVLPCDRCLAEIETPLAIPFDLLYTPAEAGSGAAGEIELQEQELDFATFENDEINLDDLVMEQIELNLPSRTLCREDCRGLCPQCGADLNLESCRCSQPVDPRWAALADLKAEMEKKKK